MNPKQGVILYGPPASGKDTVTATLTELNPRYAQFTRLKVGAGKSAGYRMGTAEQLQELEAAGDVVYSNTRYGNTYVIDRPSLDDAFVARMPVVHSVRSTASGRWSTATRPIGRWCCCGARAR